MSYYGSPYAGTGSYNSQSDFTAPRPPHDTQTYPTSQYEANAAAYGNHGVIPGLGMGFPVGGSAQYEEGDARSTYPVQDDPYVTPSTHTGGAPQPLAQNTASVHDDDMDEGEIDEGELDDVYEPSLPQPAVTAESSAAYGTHVNAEVSHKYYSPDAERGSYSPYLSPQEVQRVATPTNIDPQRPSSQALADARKEAQDTVLRLWPLKVRFNNYIDAGIDEGILRELFLSLGFDPTDILTKAVGSAQDAPKAPERGVSSPLPSAPSPMDPAKESAETRKDRIARRLAAKGSDRPDPSSELPKSTSAPTPQAAPASKAKLDKSKLLQQKMEALKKARESKQAVTPQSTDGAVGVTNSELVSQPPAAAVPATHDDAILPEGDNLEGQAEPTIASPGSSSLPPPPAAGSFKRPVASDLNDLSDAPFKRPFGQPRQPEKFLIDVSDDEDDAAMDLDSPELRPTSVHKINSPFKIPAFPETQSGFMGRQMSSPMATPRAQASGEDDLEAKLEDIADLKRRIAQREAEMKAKTSRPASPAVGASAAPPRATSVTSGSVAPGSEAHTSSVLGPPLKTKPPPDLTGETQRLPKPSELRRSEGATSRSVRSVSRAASERLIAESQARRREKELKLQFMKSQVLKMEKEIKDSLEAEERMKAEAADESEDEMEEQPSEIAEAQSTSGSADIPRSGPRLGQVSATSLVAPGIIPNNGPTEAESVSRHPDDVPSDAVAPPSISPSEEEPSEESKEAQPSDSPEHGPELRQGGPAIGELEEVPARANSGAADGAESTDIDTPEDATDEAMPDANSAQDLPDEAQDSPSSESSSEADEDEQDAGKLEEKEANTASSASPEAPGIPEIEAQDASSDSDSESDSPLGPETTPLKQPISTGQVESKPASPREQRAEDATVDESIKAGFAPYEPVSKKFRAYRFHPDFANSVPGGLRSLTYSNGIDPNLPLCPDELAGEQCPRGADCIYQHFDKLQAPDDLILMQLGEYGNYEGENKNEYNKGLRQILANAREKKIRDFDTLAKSIIDYRREFRKDPYKVLPLGDVKL